MLAKPRGDPAAVLKQGRELSPIRQLYANLYAQLYVGARFRALPNAGASEVFQRRSWIVSDLPDNAELRGRMQMGVAWVSMSDGG